MRRFVVIAGALVALSACAQPTATRVDDRTFHIEGAGTPSGSDAPNRRLAARLCPDGYRVLNSISRRNTPDGYRDEPGIFTNWTIRCL